MSESTGSGAGVGAGGASAAGGVSAAGTGAVATALPPNGGGRIAPEHPWHGFWRDLLGGGPLRSLLAIVLALLIGSLLVVFTSEDVQEAAGYFFSRPGDTLTAVWDVISGAYQSIWQGAIYSQSNGFVPLTDTLMWATPLIAGGLGVAIGFRAGLFNIGGRGQMLIAALFVGVVGASMPMPPVVHLVVAIFAGLAGGAIYAGIVGWLKAQTGAHEVIVTIMLNYVAFWLITYLLKTPAFQAEGAGGNPKAKPILETAQMPDLIGNVDFGFILAILAAVGFWFIMDRTTLGFRIRAVGINPHAARTAGINVGRTTMYTLAISGAFFGLAGATQVLGRQAAGYDPGVDAGIGFDAITVALLGANHPVGVVLAGLLFGMLKAGSFPMQIVEGIPIDIVSVIQGLIVLFIAAPPLIRAIFRLPAPTGIRLLDRVRASRGHGGGTAGGGGAAGAVVGAAGDT
ncbi:MAG: ABC transporter permease, partial [Pseudoclavibacter sp.]